MPTTLYLLRHGATPANLMKPAKLQGRGVDTDLAPVGLRQAHLTRDYLALQPFAAVYSSPLRRALQTAQIVAEPHNLAPNLVPELTECDVGHWEGKSWEEIAISDAEAYAKYHADPGLNGYLGGENFTQVRDRGTAALNAILERHAGQRVLVVSHHIVNRTYLAGVLGLPASRARAVALDNCSISVVTVEKGKATLTTLNAVFHLQGVSA